MFSQDVKDSFYRYKMPRLQSKIEGKGNGIKTVIPNMSDIAKALARPPLYVTKFFGFELGAQTIISAEADRYIVNGAHDAGKLQDVLDIFIDKFVLCRECKNPETELSISKDHSIYRDCKACGKRTEVDGRHKLANVILKNPPEKRKKAKRLAKKDSDEDEEPGEAASDDELTRNIQAAAANLPSTGQRHDDDWAVDTSEAAVRARVKDLEGVVKTTLVLGDDEDEEDIEGFTAYDVLGAWIDETEDAKDVDIFKKAQELGIEQKHRTVAVIAQCVFDEGILKQIPQHAALIKKVKP